MAYTILNTDGTTLLLLADNTVDKLATSLTLVGRNVNSYGEYLNNNLVNLLANSANTSGNPPRSPLKGQLWYDTTARRLKIYDNGFKTIGGSLISDTIPDEIASGDLWWDSLNNQLNLYNGTSIFTIGPAFPKSAGSNGWVLPPVSIKDSELLPQQVTLLTSYGKPIGMISSSSFLVSETDSLGYFNTSTTTVVSGLTIIGDIKYTGQLSNNYFSMYINIDNIAGANDVTDGANVNTVQNPAIVELLEKMYPTTTANYLTEAGVPVGSGARVLCQYTVPLFGYHVRRFYVTDQPGVGISWQPYITTATTPTNVVW